jgi:signal transduction histidine kinase
VTSPLRSRSIAARLTWMNVMVSGIALVLAYLSFLAFNLQTYRQSAVSRLTGEAQIVGVHSGSAILFNDPASAQATLAALSNSDDVMAAAIFTGQIYTGQQSPFAQFLRAGARPIQPRAIPNGVNNISWVKGLDILTGSRIVVDGKPAGTVYIQAHLHGLREQAIRYATIAGVILFLCLGVALLVGAIFRRILAQPIVSLAEITRQVTRHRDYSLRFQAGQSYDELASLIEAFNEMLAEIQQRDAALELAKNDLELRVKERTAQLQAANQELEAFSYSVAHDLRGPLQTIANICYLMQISEQPAAADANAPVMSALQTSVTTMSNMIEDLLDLSRSTSTQLSLAHVDMSPLATSIFESLAALNPDRKVEVVIQPGCGANADYGLMQIVLQNLFRNAWKFTGASDSAKIEFGCRQQGGVSVFHVRDNGAGFDPELADRLFKPFQRLHATSEFPGTGIGLATVYRIIERHDGEIWAEGEVGKGAVFYFTLGAPRP